MSKFFSPHSGRVYIHKACGEATIVTERDFVLICNPFYPCTGTLCLNCGRAYSLTQFFWEDTGESLPAFRNRVRRSSPTATVFAWLVAPLAGALIGAAAMSYIDVPELDTRALMAFGAACGGLVSIVFVAPLLIGLVAGRQFYDRK
jgi:hypothetical protein